MSKLGDEGNTCRVAVVGAGPSGFYVADSFFRSEKAIQVDMIDALPTPFGLLRGGVAPDHQRMKSVGSYYERVAVKNKGRFNFIGNVTVGRDVSVETLKNYYDIIVFSYGASDDRKLGLPGEELRGNFSAREFVGWYNGHPDYQDYEFDLSCENVVIIGQGNVAIDVARILVKTDEELASSDITAHARSVLKDSKIKNIYLIGRRGPVQSAFTNQEVIELGELDNCSVVINPTDLDLSDADQIELEDEKNNKARKNVDALNGLLALKKSSVGKKIHILFYSNPQKIIGHTSVEGLEIEKVCLIGDAFSQRVDSLNEFKTIPCSLLFRSIGYQGVPMEGVPFDARRCVIPNDQGRVLGEDGKPLIGFYTAGWIKRGPTGVLGTNKPDGFETVQSAFADLPSIAPCVHRSTDDFISFLKKKDLFVFSFEDWQKIDLYEKSEGEKVGKPREKLTSVSEMISVVNA